MNSGSSFKNFSFISVGRIIAIGLQAEILNISANKPLHKEFSVRLKTPLKPRQRKRFVTIEYDWEEPERTFFYKVPTDCKSYYDYPFIIYLYPLLSSS